MRSEQSQLAARPEKLFYPADTDAAGYADSDDADADDADADADDADTDDADDADAYDHKFVLLLGVLYLLCCHKRR